MRCLGCVPWWQMVVLCVPWYGLGTSWVLLGDSGCPVPAHITAATCSQFGYPRVAVVRLIAWGHPTRGPWPHGMAELCFGVQEGAQHRLSPSPPWPYIPHPKNPRETKVSPPSNAPRTPNLPGQPPAVSPPPLAHILRASPAPHLALGMGCHPQQLSSGTPVMPSRGTAPGGRCRAAVPPTPAVPQQPQIWGQWGCAGLGAELWLWLWGQHRDMTW